MAIRIKTMPPFERGEHVEKKYKIRNDYWFFQNTKKGIKLKN